MWWVCSAAWAAEPWWGGEWGLDPSQSDDPSIAIERAYVAPAPVPGADKYSPDGGQTDVEEDRRKLLYETLAILGVSGRMSLARDGEAVVVGWGDGDSVHLSPSGKWAKVVDADGRKYRIRVFEEPELLVVERKVSGTLVTETLVPPKDVGELVVVVRIDGAQLDPGVEFRRVYRALE